MQDTTVAKVINWNEIVTIQILIDRKIAKKVYICSLENLKSGYSIITVQSVLPLIKKPASSRSPIRSHTSLLVTQCRAVTAPV